METMQQTGVILCIIGTAMCVGAIGLLLICALACKMMFERTKAHADALVKKTTHRKGR